MAAGQTQSAGVDFDWASDSQHLKPREKAITRWPPTACRNEPAPRPCSVDEGRHRRGYFFAQEMLFRTVSRDAFTDIRRAGESVSRLRLPENKFHPAGPFPTGINGATKVHIGLPHGYSRSAGAINPVISSGLVTWRVLMYAAASFFSATADPARSSRSLGLRIFFRTLFRGCR